MTIEHDTRHDTDGFQTWLHKRGRGRSASQYIQVINGYLDDPGTYETKITSSSLSPNYRRHLAAVLRQWAKYTKNKDLIAHLEELRLPAPIPKGPKEPFDRETWFSILDEIEGADYLKSSEKLVCSLVATRGIRVGDALRITRKEIQQALKTGLLVFEGKRERRTTFSAAPIAEYLEELLGLPWGSRARVRWLVSPRSADDHRAQRNARNRIGLAFKRVADNLDIEPEDMHSHKFRHTYATHYLSEMKGDEEAIFKLQQQMGWARLDTAQNYLRRSRRGELDQVEQSLLAGRRTREYDKKGP